MFNEKKSVIKYFKFILNILYMGLTSSNVHNTRNHFFWSSPYLVGLLIPINKQKFRFSSKFPTNRFNVHFFKWVQAQIWTAFGCRYRSLKMKVFHFFFLLKKAKGGVVRLERIRTANFDFNFAISFTI